MALLGTISQRIRSLSYLETNSEFSGSKIALL